MEQQYLQTIKRKTMKKIGYNENFILYAYVGFKTQERLSGLLKKNKFKFKKKETGNTDYRFDIEVNLLSSKEAHDLITRVIYS